MKPNTDNELLSLNDFTIPVQCHENWDEMSGNERQKFCQVCNKKVHNVSNITKEEFFQLNSEENSICIRFSSTENKTAIAQIKQKKLFTSASFCLGLLTFLLSFIKPVKAAKTVLGKLSVSPSAETRDVQVEQNTKNKSIPIDKQNKTDLKDNSKTPTELMGKPHPSTQPERN